MRASFYLSQFDLKIKYRLDKNNIVLDALSRLFSKNNLIIIDRIVSTELDLVSYYVDIDDLFDEFDNYAMQNIITIIFDEFHIKITKNYDDKI